MSMKRPIHIILTLILSLPLAVSAQYANDWVVDGQQYLKISIAADGLYKLTYDNLVDAGLQVSAIDPRRIQVYHRGEEQAILFHHDQSPANDQFDAGEYLEFYGRKNDGTLDAGLYQPVSAQPHNYYNLFSDTTAYFLTWTSAAVQGKRIETFDQANTTNIPKEELQFTEDLRLFTSQYNGGEGSTLLAPQSFYNQGEGWTGEGICAGPGCGVFFRDYTFGTLSPVVGGALPHIEMLISGREDVLHTVEILVGPTNGSLRQLTTKTFEDFESIVVSEDIAASDFGPTGLVTIRLRAAGPSGVRDLFSPSYMRLSTPQGFDLAGGPYKEFRLAANEDGKSYIELTNAQPSTRLFDITDPSNVVAIGTRPSGPLLTAVIPNTETSKKLLCVASVQSLQPGQLQRVTFRDLTAHASFIIISHPSLRHPAGDYADPVKAYASYRASAEGGGHDTLTVMIDELYNQFNYGERSPLAVREFMRMKLAQGAEYLFIIGKGRDPLVQLGRRPLNAGEQPDLVPTGGSPPSDIVFAMDLGKGQYVPSFSVGRLPAILPLHVADYLDKIKETEDPDAGFDWQKRVLHLSGGVQPNELTLFRSYMTGFEQIARDKYLGADVKTLGKHSVSPVEFINIAEEVNEGVNLVTFFGHSSSNTTDIDIGRVTDPLLNYHNQAKYPVFLVNGCNAGYFFDNGFNFGEDWVLAGDRGARNFIANSAFGFDATLRYYTETFYKTGLGDSVFINRGIGDVQVEVASRLLTGVTESSTISAQIQQAVLLGDPAVKMFNYSLPDYGTSDIALQVSAFDGQKIHALSDSLKVSLVVTNRGRANGRPLAIRLVHGRGGETEKDETVDYLVIGNDTLTWTLTRGNGTFHGANRLDIYLDPLDSIEELDEANNHATWSQLIVFNGTQNLQPPPFGIVGQTLVELVFQDTDLMAGQKTYELEIDSVADFSSDFRQFFTVDAAVLARKQITLPAVDSSVYYWRTRPVGAPDPRWETTSFAFIGGSDPGFAQLRYDQATSNTLDGLVSSAAENSFEFEQTQSSFSIRTYGPDNASAPVNGSFQVNNAEYYHSPQGFNCRTNTINLVAFDRGSVVPYLGVPFTYQNSYGRSCGREPMIINSFTASEVDTGNGDDLFRYIDLVKPGDSVVLFTMGDAGILTWTASVKTKLGELGIATADLDALSVGEPVIILGRKGAAPGQAQVVRVTGSDPQAQELQVNGTLTGRIPSGSMQSVIIGPALAWRNISSRTLQIDASDSVRVDIFGVGPDGQQELLHQGVQPDYDLTHIDATLYSHLKLRFVTSDEEVLTPAQLNHWIVGYDPAPDGLLVLRNPRAPVTVQEGQQAQLQLSFVNISPVAFQDSLTMYYGVRNLSSGLGTDGYVRIHGPASSDSTHFNIDIATRSKVGLNDLNITANTLNVAEQYHQNNTIALPGHLLVFRDNIDPLLDVVVDGRYLANGDIVSPTPSINIRLSDENPFLSKLDTTAMQIFLTYPCATGDCSAKRVNFSGNDVTWASDDSQPDLRVNFLPAGLEDGEYELRVEGYDVSGNPSGTEPYVIRFNVESDPVLAYAQPYPNPSSDGFFFGFRSSGNEAPGGMSLDIYTREGRQVAHFEETDADPLHVGWNQMKWTGLDAHGVALSPGLYFYRMAVIVMGETYVSSGKLMIAH
jgi:hypothetical protein